MQIIGIFLLLIILGGSSIFFIIQNKQIILIEPTKKQLNTITYVPTQETPIEIILKKGKQVFIPNSEVKIVYVGADIPNPNCIDCSTTTNLVIEKNKIEKNLNYLCGGIAGKCTDKLEGFDYQIELVDISQTSAKVRIVKK